jgi:MFS family permease
VLLVVTVGTFLAPLDSSIVNIALPDIATEFGASLTSVGWVSSAYLLTSAALVLTMGRLGDIWGLRKVYVTGFVAFGVGSLTCAISPTLALLVLSRWCA